MINASPSTGAGDIYQPENRISAQKTVWYNAVSGVTHYKLPVIVDSIVKVIVDGKDPSWFLLTNTNFLAASYKDNELYFLDSVGRLITLQSASENFGRAFERYYRIGSQYFESYDQLKNINSVIISLGADYVSNTTQTYLTDYATYDGPTNLKVVAAAEYEEEKEP